jgi:pimeloyl-ACP methyl ester carboxylesterase
MIIRTTIGWSARSMRRAWITFIPIVLIGASLSLAACLPLSPEGALANLPQPTPIAAVGEAGAVRAAAVSLADGTVISYTLILPPNYVAGEPYPTLLALPPGSQTQGMVDAGLDSYWRAGALANGWVVVSPVAPQGELFFQGAERFLPEFLLRIATQYPPEGGKFHLSGVSNGGLSAFRIAGRNPDFFHSLLALPGYPITAEDQANLEQLTALPIALFVGQNDTGWIGPMRETAATLKNQGANVTLAMVPDEGHFIRSLIGGETLFVLLESFRNK